MQRYFQEEWLPLYGPREENEEILYSQQHWKIKLVS